MGIKSFKDLLVWQKSIDLIVELYGLTASLPHVEKYGLISQMQRASISIPSNIAEGSKRRGPADFRQFCLISLGSAAELETQLLITQRLYDSVEVSDLLEHLAEVQKMLNGLVKSLGNNITPKTYKLITNH